MVAYTVGFPTMCAAHSSRCSSASTARAAARPVIGRERCFPHIELAPLRPGNTGYALGSESASLYADSPAGRIRLAKPTPQPEPLQMRLLVHTWGANLSLKMGNLARMGK